MTIAYDTAAALAMTAGHLADAVDDNHPGWPRLAWRVRVLADALGSQPGSGGPTPPGGPDVEAIATRAAAAPDGYWVTMPDGLWIPWAAPDDTDLDSAWDHGRYIGIHDGDWHGTTGPPAALWAFLAAARDDVLTLAAEVRRLRAALTTERATVAVPRPGEWDCPRCGAAWFGTPPYDGRCPGCHPGGEP